MDLLKKDEFYCSQGDTSGKHSPKKIFSRAEDCYLYDANGVKYLDMQMFNSAANFGYQNEKYSKCITQSLDTLPCLAGEFMSESRILLSEKICKYMSDNYKVDGRVHFTVGGAQAVDDALKLAINKNHKRDFLAFEGAYHGRTMASSSVSSSYRYTRQFGSVLDVQRIPFPCCDSCPYDKTCNNCNLYCLEKFKEKFNSEFSGFYDVNNSEAVASAFILEPVLGRGGYVFPNEKYLSELCQFLHNHNILVIADEVQMGFFRTGRLWSFENYGIVPDIIVFGKAISNGLWPLSGVWANSNIISPDLWPVGSTHCTFAGHPLATQLGLCTFEIIEDNKFINRITKSATKLHECIKQITSDFSCFGRLQMKGHAIGIDIIDFKTGLPNGEFAHHLIETALNNPYEIDGTPYGLILTVGGMFNSSLMLSPWLFITDEDISRFDILFRHFLRKAFEQ